MKRDTTLFFMCLNMFAGFAFWIGTGHLFCGIPNMGMGIYYAYRCGMGAR